MCRRRKGGRCTKGTAGKLILKQTLHRMDCEWYQLRINRGLPVILIWLHIFNVRGKGFW